jgi:hypothetical protein
MSGLATSAWISDPAKSDSPDRQWSPHVQLLGHLELATLLAMANVPRGAVVFSGISGGRSVLGAGYGAVMSGTSSVVARPAAGSIVSGVVAVAAYRGGSSSSSTGIGLLTGSNGSSL